MKIGVFTYRTQTYPALSLSFTPTLTVCNSVLAADGLVVTMAKTSSILTDSVWFACTVTVTEIAHSVERPTQKPGTILTRVRVPGAARDFSRRVNFQC